MLSTKSLPAAITCNACHFRLLSAFAASAGIQLLPPQASRLPLRWGPRQRPTFSSIARKAGERDTKLPQIADPPHSDPAEKNIFHESQVPEKERAAERSDTSSASYTPWYLQEHATLAKNDQNPFLDRQRIPDLPENAPPLLQPVLQHISTDLGLDDLSLLDLRNLDPPPALGGNLIMIIGTARSEKHLHVSADRHCRWLRSTYKLHPFADGLLGRNEIKLKLRRKARRSKILRNVGASEAGEIDDDLRSGWVCVNLGKVEPAASQLEVEKGHEDSGFVGFGPRSEGVRLVVQMFTEEKRGQFDLESLWGGVLRRDKKEKEKEREATVRDEALDKHARNDVDPKANDLLPADPQDYHKIPMHTRPASLQQQPGFGGQQLRHFHSCRKAYHALELDGLDENGSGASTDLPITSKIPMGLNEHYPPQGSSSDALDSAETLRALLKQLHNAPVHEAKEMLGESWTISSGPSQRSPFMDCFIRNFPSFPEMSHWQSLIGIARYAVELHGVGRKNLISTLQGMQEAGEQISRETYVELLETITHARPDNQTLSHVFDILDMMTCDGYSIFEERVFFLLHEAVVLPTKPLPLSVHEDGFGGSQDHNTGNLNRSEQTLAHKERVLAAMDHFFVAFSGDAPYLSLLRSYANARYWPGFFSLWSSLPRRMRSRSREMYVLFFETLADSQEKDLIEKILHDAIDDMEVEQPRVEFDKDMAGVVAECVKTAVPDIERRMSTERAGMITRGWDILWMRCQRALKT